MSEHEFREAAHSVIADACDGDRKDNFARMLTIEDMIMLYLVAGDDV